MVKQVRLCILLLVLPLPMAQGATIAADSCSQEDVQAAVESADYGDTVLVPNGNCTWTSGIRITKDIKITGGGSDRTILNMGFTDDHNYEAFFEFFPDETDRNRLQGLNSPGIIEVTGFNFAGNERIKYKYGIWIKNINTKLIRKVKVHHNKFIMIHRAVQTDGNVYGVFYENQLIGTNAAYPIGYELDSWNNHPMRLGSGDGWYIEDNVFSFVSGEDGDISGGGHGMGHVIRYNTMTGTVSLYIESHGNQLSYIRGTQITEIYGNYISATSHQGIDLRGGKCMVFFNKLNDDSLDVREEFKDSASGVPLENACPEGDGPQICSDDCVCMKVNHSYFFNNRAVSDSSLLPFFILYDRYDNVHENNPPELVENREFWQQHSIGTFDGSVDAVGSCGYYHGPVCTKSGIGYGTIEDMDAIEPKAAGLGFWVTDQDCEDISDMVGRSPARPIRGVLYRSQYDEGSGRYKWEPYYQPYKYPHPLRTAPVNADICGEGEITQECWCEGMKSRGHCFHGYYAEDVNQDGSVDISDVQLVVNVILDNATNSRADVNGDGSVIISDVQEVVSGIMG